MERFIRVNYSSILVLDSLVKNLNQKDKEENSDIRKNYENILGVKVWNLIGSKHALIRKSIFIFISSVISNFPGNYSKRKSEEINEKKKKTKKIEK